MTEMSSEVRLRLVYDPNFTFRSSESEAPVIKGSEESVSSSSSESDSEDEGGSVVGGASLSILSQLGGTSTCRSDSSIFTATSEVSRKK